MYIGEFLWSQSYIDNFPKISDVERYIEQRLQEKGLETLKIESSLHEHKKLEIVVTLQNVLLRTCGHINSIKKNSKTWTATEKRKNLPLPMDKPYTHGIIGEHGPPCRLMTQFYHKKGTLELLIKQYK